MEERVNIDGSEHETNEGRVLAALSYVAFLCFLPVFLARSNKFAHFHARQGAVLFFIEVVVFLALSILDKTIGLIPVLGFLIVIPIKFVVLVGLLLAASAGFVKSIQGEYWKMPVLGDYAERVPF